MNSAASSSSIRAPAAAWQPIETNPFVSAKRYLIHDANEIAFIGFRYYEEGPWIGDGQVVKPLRWMELPDAKDGDKS